MADEINGGGSMAPAAAPAPAPSAPTPAPSAATPPPSSSAPAGPGPSQAPASGTPGATAPAAAGQQWTGVRDALKGYGLDPAQFSDDHAALAALVNGYQQSRQFAPLIPQVNEYVRHADQFGEWSRQQQAAAAAAEAKKKEWFSAPAYDPSWDRFLRRDPTSGDIVATADAPPGIVEKYKAAQNHQRDFLQKFAFDPLGSIKPGVEQVARQIAEEIVREKLGGYQVQNQAQQFIAENSSWLHAQDGQGNVTRDATGQPLLSEWGQRFQGYLLSAQRAGITDYEAKKTFALTSVQRDYLLSQHQQGSQSVAAPTAPTPAGNPAQEQFLQQAAQRRGSVAAPAAPPGAPASPVAMNRHTLQQKMLADLAAGGFNAGQTIEGRR